MPIRPHTVKIEFLTIVNNLKFYSILGRARPTICELYNWRYEKLGNLPHTSTWPEFRYSNAGLVWDYQVKFKGSAIKKTIKKK